MDNHNADEVPGTDDYDERSERWSNEAFANKAFDDDSSTEHSSANEIYGWVPPYSDVKFAKSADVCDRCAHIPWKALLEGTGSLKRIRIKESQEVLKQSFCRICRFLAWIMEEEGLGDGLYVLLPRDTPIPREGCYNIDKCSGTLEVHKSDRDNEVEQSLGRDREVLSSLITLQGRQEYISAPHFMLTNSTPDDAAFERRCHHSQEIDARQIRDWVEECETNHHIGCTMDAATQTALRELRVIDCEMRIVVRAPPDCRYTALSYVWGPPSDVSESIQEPPKTIAQSMLFTQKLGYKYLWVDRYCINQDDRVDKHTQVMQMGDIYAAAQITFIAAAGNDPTYGLPGVLPHSRHQQKCEMIGAIHLLSLPRLHHLGTVAGSEWASRAWTFQEFHRSRRRMIFTESQIIFVCNSATRYEFEDYGITQEYEEARWLEQWLPPCNVAKTSDEQDRDAMDRATGYLEAYSNRQLSYDSDALNAIAGALDPLFTKFTYHVAAVPYRHAIRYAYDGPGDFEQSSLSALREEFGSMVVAQRRSYPSINSRTVIISGTPIILERARESYTARIDQLGFEHRQDTEIALLWYHEQPCRRRSEFPSWSPLGWVGKLQWFRDADGHGEVLLASTCGVRLHSRSMMYDIRTQRGQQSVLL